MGIDAAIAITHEALMVILKIVLPPLGITALLSAALMLFQTATNINESTLQQDAKFFATLLILFVTGPAIYLALRDYTGLIFERIAMLQ
ncbi:flagellar biosynthetic protein FliQ [Azospirillum picis]|uniref:Flagellar biosynthetic protein FliQ n=1 Tax=Azospirillum picis TaxID=488438 RepID=A0ABU0MQ11_9PROT|nr:flagellar biosynthetic protein FliQ [Azospirillum picis]MBP2301606.1 flagellar biosynthetic protein FliQ [Azospirillum picis]MDQ0535571.1 flagellar biosynthetic protein FliQ [Azospirillum picis]